MSALRYLFIAIGILIILGDNSFAAPVMANCKDPALDRAAPTPPGVRTPKPNVLHGEPKMASIRVNGQERQINYELHKARVRPPKGTVVYMCGGPGVVCNSEGRPESIPPDFDVIAYDYLGTGQNQSVRNDEEMSIEAQGQVTAGLVRKLGLQNYVLYGSSFGTTVATVAGSLLSKDGGAKPKSLVLDGVVSRGVDLNHEAAINRAATRAWNLLSDSEQRRFGQLYEEKTKTMTAEQRSELDASLISLLLGGPRYTAEGLRRFLKGVIPKMPDIAANEAANRQYRAAGCQQLRPRQPPLPERYFGGRVQNTRIGVDPVSEGTPCDCPLIQRPFDSQLYQVQGVPIIYVNSDTDVLTPIEGARRHLETQSEAREKILINVRDGMHGDLEALTDCSGTVWNAAITGSLSTLMRQLSAVQSNACRPARSRESPNTAR